MSQALSRAIGILLVLALVLEKLRPVLIWPLLLLVGWINLAGQNSAI